MEIEHTGSRYDRLPATLQVVTKVAPLYGAKIHGDTETEIDIEFPNALAATSFVASSGEWSLRLRDPITDIGAPVVLIMTKDDQVCGRSDCWCEPSQYMDTQYMDM